MLIKIKDTSAAFIAAEWHNLSPLNWSMWEDTTDWWRTFHWGSGWTTILRSGTGLWRSNYVWIFMYIHWLFFKFGFAFLRFWFNFPSNDVDNICKWRENCFLSFFFKHFYACRKCTVYCLNRHEEIFHSTFTENLYVLHQYIILIFNMMS